MAEKILYYLGAGASAQVLPLARSVNDAQTKKIVVPGLIYELTEFSRNNEFRYIQDHYGDLPQEIFNNCSDLAENAKSFGDIDTYAKYLLLMQDEQAFKKLKKTLAQYFSIKQILLQARDKRYLPWLVSLMSSKTFPEDVKILSWNYDYQVQLAAAEIGQAESINFSRSTFEYSPPSLLFYPNLDPTFREIDRLSLIHLNGIAGYKNEKNVTDCSFQSKYVGDTGKLLRFLTDNSLEGYMHFAWEGDGYHNRLMDSVRKMVYGTTIMVVIGYSFPFFNRQVDKEVFNVLKAFGDFRKIYYQDPKLDGQQLYAQFELSERINIEHISQTDNFHIPFEF